MKGLKYFSLTKVKKQQAAPAEPQKSKAELRKEKWAANRGTAVSGAGRERRVVGAKGGTVEERAGTAYASSGAGLSIRGRR
jgi:hypothetical protein